MCMMSRVTPSSRLCHSFLWRTGAIPGVCAQFGVPSRRGGHHFRTRQDLGGVLALAHRSERVLGHVIGEQLSQVGFSPAAVSPDSA